MAGCPAYAKPGHLSTNAWYSFRSKCRNQEYRSGARNETHHVRVPIKRFHPCQQLLVISQTDQDLSVVPDALLKYRQRTLRDLLLLQFLDLTLVHIRLAHVGELTVDDQISFSPISISCKHPHLILESEQ